MKTEKTPPAMIPSQARPLPHRLGFPRMSRRPRIPNRSANGAGKRRKETRPRYPAAMAHGDLPTGSSHFGAEGALVAVRKAGGGR